MESRPVSPGLRATGSVDISLPGGTIQYQAGEFTVDQARCAGGVMTAQQARWALSAGADYVDLGKAGILAHDFPELLRADPELVSRSLPVSPEELRSQGVGEKFIAYLRNQRNFVVG